MCNNLTYETFESSYAFRVHRLRPVGRRWRGDFGNPHGHTDRGRSRFHYRCRAGLDTTQQQIAQIFLDAGITGLSLSGTSLLQNSDYSTNPAITQTQVIYQFTFSVPAAGLKDAAKIMETLRIKPPALLKSFQYSAALNASQSTVDAMRQTLLPQLLAEAQKKAQTLAAAAGLKLGGVKGVSDSYSASGYSYASLISSSQYLGGFSSSSVAASGTQYIFSANVTFSVAQ